MGHLGRHLSREKPERVLYVNLTRILRQQFSAREYRIMCFRIFEKKWIERNTTTLSYFSIWVGLVHLIRVVNFKLLCLRRRHNMIFNQISKTIPSSSLSAGVWTKYFGRVNLSRSCWCYVGKDTWICEYICRREWIAQVRVCKLSKIRSRRWPRTAASCALHPSGPAGCWCTCIHASTLVLLYICILWAGGVFWRYTFTLEYLYDCFFGCQWLASTIWWLIYNWFERNRMD